MNADSTRALEWLYGHAPRGIDLGLDRMHEALAHRGDPHRALRVIHVAGTNGKGSVSATLESVIRRAGYRTGLYTSPHLHRFVERVRIDGTSLGEDAMTALIEGQRADDGLPALSFFERATLLAFEAFRDSGVDVAVVEVGLGGRLDATNVVAPIMTVITHVAMDHESYLGDTLALVAREKAGILKPHVPAITSTRGEARAVIAEVASGVHAPLAAIDTDFALGEDDAFEGLGARITQVRPTLAGAHQRDNLAAAIATLVGLRALGFALDDDTIRAGVADVRWPGRLERIEGAPELVLDAAHNPNGCEALAAHLRTLPKKRTALLFGAMRDKATPAMLAALDDVVDARVFVAPTMTRAESPAALARIRAGEACASIDEGLERARALAGPHGRVVVAGSIFVLAHVRAAALGIESDPPIGL